MKASEFLRSLADIVARSEDSGVSPQDVEHQDNSADLQKVNVDNTDNTDCTTMIPPLQQKMELLKKAAGVDSVYDNEGQEDDPLNQLKKAAGISTVATFTAGEDNDVAD